MNDPTIALMQDLIIAETSEPMLLSNPPQQSKHAILYRRALEGLRNLKRRINDLLEANVRYESRARKAEAFLQRVITESILDADLEEQIEEHLQAPWLLEPLLGSDSQPE